MRPSTYIGIMGANGSGKTDVVSTWLAMLDHDYRFLNFADPLKEAALDAGWSGVKDEAGRAWLQDFSEEEKKKHGEMVFYERAMEQGTEDTEENVPLCVFGDVRFLHEIQGLLALKAQGAKVHLIRFWNIQAQVRWAHAFNQYMTTLDPRFKWSVHRSELEWRVYVEHAISGVNLFTNNNFNEGLESAAVRFDHLVKIIDSYNPTKENTNA